MTREISPTPDWSKGQCCPDGALTYYWKKALVCPKYYFSVVPISFLSEASTDFWSAIDMMIAKDIDHQ